MLAELGRAFQLLLADIDFVASEPRVVCQQRPRQRIIVRADTHKAAKAHDRVSDLAAQLVDHHALDLADPLSARTIDRRPLDLVAPDQHWGFALVESYILSRAYHIILARF